MNLGQHILICLVQIYRCTLSPTKTFLFGPLGGCRFTPSCSQYALDSIRIHGVISGSGLSLKRICRCHPFGGCGDDPVPGSIRVPHVESGGTPDSRSSNNYFKQLEERGSRRDASNRTPEARAPRFKIQDSKFKTALHGS